MCLACGKRMRDEQALGDHKRDKHGVSKPVSASHARRREQPLECGFCSKVFCNQQALLDHCKDKKHGNNLHHTPAVSIRVKGANGLATRSPGRLAQPNKGQQRRFVRASRSKSIDSSSASKSIDSSSASNHRSNRQALDCPTCGKRMRDWRALVDHCKDKHNTVLPQSPPQKSVHTMPIECDACGRHLLNELALQDHIRDKHADSSNHLSSRIPSKRKPEVAELAAAKGARTRSKRTKRLQSVACRCCGSTAHTADRCPNRSLVCPTCGKTGQQHEGYYCFKVRLPSSETKIFKITARKQASQPFPFPLHDIPRQPQSLGTPQFSVGTHTASPQRQSPPKTNQRRSSPAQRQSPVQRQSPAQRQSPVQGTIVQRKSPVQQHQALQPMRRRQRITVEQRQKRFGQQPLGVKPLLSLLFSKS
jgi:hypothetical protein